MLSARFTSVTNFHLFSALVVPLYVNVRATLEKVLGHWLLHNIDISICTSKRNFKTICMASNTKQKSVVTYLIMHTFRLMLAHELSHYSDFSLYISNVSSMLNSF